jgi:hypothetical protein
MILIFYLKTSKFNANSALLRESKKDKSLHIVASFFALNPNNLQLTVGILIFDQVEVLDVAGPFEVFSVTRLNEESGWKEPFPFRVILVS